jgi:hypothetical protein
MKPASPTFAPVFPGRAFPAAGVEGVLYYKAAAKGIQRREQDSPMPGPGSVQSFIALSVDFLR